MYFVHRIIFFFQKQNNFFFKLSKQLNKERLHLY